MRTDTLKFLLDTGSGLGFEAHPAYDDNLAIDIERESGQQFYRRKFSGKLKFVGTDYDAIMAAAFDQRISILIQLTNYPDSGDLFYDNPFVGFFYRADCEIDEGAKTIEVTPSTDDAYTPILDGWEKEFNLTKLAPEIVPLNMARRPVIQVYNQGRDTVTCILSQMSWEQNCEAVSNPGDYGFVRLSPAPDQLVISVFQKEAFDWGAMPPVPNVFYIPAGSTRSAAKDGYYAEIAPATSWVQIRKESDDSVVWENVPPGESLVQPFEYELLSLDPDFTGKRLIMQGIRVYLWMRIVCDVPKIGSYDTSALRTDDFVGYLPGYRRYLDLSLGGINEVFLIQETMSPTPTEWGVSKSGNYYVQPVYPSTAGYGEILPICRNSWDDFSIWWLSEGNPLESLLEVQGRKAMTLRDAYPLHSVISVLLNAIGATAVTFGDDATYSEFFYGNTAGAIRGDDDTQIFITPKSNLVAVDYDQAAQRGQITLKAVFDMLRDVYRCFWFIEGGKLRIEHIAYFMRGGNYVGPMGVGLDLTDMYYTRPGKAVAEGQTKYNYDKPETYERIEFGWMDDVTTPFDGWPIEILSGYVVKGKKEEVTLSKFTSDLDYILLNPEGVSKDGFVLLGAHEIGGAWTVPFVNFYEDENTTPKYVLQNGYLAFLWLTRYYMYDLCAPNYQIDGEAGVAVSTAPLKSQEVSFPAPVVFPTQWLPDTTKLIKTFIGSGRIHKMTANIVDLTIKATLNYGTS